MKSSPSPGRTHLSQHCWRWGSVGFLWTFMFLYVPAWLPVPPGFLCKCSHSLLLQINPNIPNRL